MEVFLNVLTFFFVCEFNGWVCLMNVLSIVITHPGTFWLRAGQKSNKINK